MATVRRSLSPQVSEAGFLPLVPNILPRVYPQALTVPFRQKPVSPRL